MEGKTLEEKILELKELGEVRESYSKSLKDAIALIVNPEVDVFIKNN